MGLYLPGAGMSLRSRLRRLERQKQAEDNRPPGDGEMRDAALTGQGRPLVLSLVDQFAAYAVELRDATHGFCPLPGGHP